MKRSAKRRLSCLLSAILLLVMSLDMSAFAGVFEKTARKIDVWDFGGVAESNTEMYQNNISASDWDNCSEVGSDAKFSAASIKFGDLTLITTAGDRLYSTSSKNYGASGFATTKYADGYTANGMFYSNGTGGETRRCFTIDNVKAGDKIVVYMVSSTAATSNLIFKYLGEAGTQQDSKEFSNIAGKYEFIAKYDGQYKVYADAVAGKPCYNRVVRIPGVNVSGTIDLNGADIKDYKIVFKDEANDISYEAEVNNGSFNVVLAAGCDYTAALSGVTGYGFTSDTKVLSTKTDDAISGKDGVVLKVEAKSVYKYTGKLTGFDKNYDISKLSVKLEADKNTLADDVTLNLNSDMTFEATLEPDVEYTAVLYGVNDYEIVKGATILDNKDVSSDIEVALKKVYKATGKFNGLDDASKVTAIKFVNVNDKYEYIGTVKDGGYEVSLRDGSYQVVTTVDDYRTTTHVVVKGSDVSKDILFVSTKKADALTRVPDIYVGYEDKAELNYNTVKEAVAAAAAMNPSKEDERVTIHIKPGTYREQVVVTTPYISFVNDEKNSGKEVLLTWYYGIGYEYYSIDSTGFYNEENAYDKYEKAQASKWGCSVYVKNSAAAFRADGITFEASFNRYITDEEIEDGVNAADTKLPQRTYGLDATSKAATERATALAIEADKTEFTNCAFLGSQDTLYTGNSATNLYFKNCRIEGNTDYIFGDGDAVFDGCELRFFGYSTGSVGGYITAHKPGTATQYGYLFRNCTITGNSDLTVKAGYLGRPWGADARVTFINTKMTDNLINDAGWFEMAVKPEKANFAEYNTRLTTGEAVDLSKRAGKVLSDSNAAAVNVKSYFGSWTPVSYKEESSTVEFKTVPFVVDNGDINAPYPGHTLTAGYSLGDANDANDASVIRWYSVDKDGKETLVKSSTANVDKTYKITKNDIGNYIKVVVVPETLSGNKAAEKSYKVEAFVRDGFEDPSGSTDIELGDGVNIFLAGDSTVKDYSAAGMYMSGKAQSEGAWGEFLQSFFDSSKVKVQNYANGGRSSRNFINEGSLDKIKQNIKEGDYLFIQFGHNDCANGTGYLEDRYVPLGTPDADGVYPSTAGTKAATPSSLVSKYGDTFYSYDCGGTYKWYLQQYIDAAKSVGAIPVLVTPVSRLYYNSDGTIKPHHDSTDKTTGTYVSSNDAYVTAVKQLANEQNVLLLDGFAITKSLYEETYKNDSSAKSGVSQLATQIMAAGDKTHSNKLGGFITAALFALQLQDMDLSISKAVSMPAKTAGINPDGQQIFSINGSSEFTAYTTDDNGKYSTQSEYWTNYGQELIKAIGIKKDELNKTPDPVPDPTPTPDPDPEPDPSVKATVWVVGDSTVSSFSDKYYYPRYGWGTQLSAYFDDTLTVNNLALSGRSSKSYTSEPQYKTLIDGMQSGDYLLIGFGHNDEKAEEARYTNPNGDYKTAGSFANSLYENYIKPAQAKGVTVVVCTPIVRRTATKEWANSNLHITSASGAFEGGDYAKSIINLGKDTGVAVVDMTSLTKQLYDELGPDETVNLHAWTSSKPSSVDNTHTNIWGGRYNAYLITKTIKELGVKGISSHIIDAEAPKKEDVLKKNPDYKETEYVGVVKDSTIWSPAGVFKGTVFGNVGGAPSKSNQTLEMNDNKFHIQVKNNKGKIGASADGVAMFYYKVPVKSTFTITANATVNSFDSNDQVSFGLMARDDMYIDENRTDVLGDYVAAGPLKLATAGGVWNCFARKSGVLTQGGTCKNEVKAGQTYALKIESNSDGYACTFGDEAAITGGFDFMLTTVDSEYVYVGMFVARNADVTFSDVTLIVDGEVITGNVPAPDPDPAPDPTPDPDPDPTPDPKPTEPGSTVVDDVIEKTEGVDEAVVKVSSDAVEITKEEEALIEAGKDLHISAEIKNAKDTVTKEQKELIDSVVKKYAENGITGLYLDIKMIKNIGDDYKAEVSELSAPATFSVKIADELKNTDSSKERTYSVVRIHGEKAEVIDSTFYEASSTLTFSTDRFSVYAVVYEDKAKSSEITKPDNGNTNTGNDVNEPSSSETVTPGDSQNTDAVSETPKTPDTGDSFGKDIMAASFAMIICAMGAAYVLFTRKRRQF